MDPMPLGRHLLRYQIVPLLIVATQLFAAAASGSLDGAKLQRPPRTPIGTRTPTSTPTPTRTPAIVTYVLTDESKLWRWWGSQPPQALGPLTGTIEVVAREGRDNRHFDFEIRRLDLHGAHYHFTGQGGVLKVDRRNRLIATSMQALLHVSPYPAGGSVDGGDIEFEGGSALYFSRYPPSLRSLTIFGPERPAPFQLRLLIFAEPAR